MSGCKIFQSQVSIFNDVFEKEKPDSWYITIRIPVKTVDILSGDSLDVSKQNLCATFELNYHLKADVHQSISHTSLGFRNSEFIFVVIDGICNFYIIGE